MRVAPKRGCDAAFTASSGVTMAGGLVIHDGAIVVNHLVLGPAEDDAYILPVEDRRKFGAPMPEAQAPRLFVGDSIPSKMATAAYSAPDELDIYQLFNPDYWGEVFRGNLDCTLYESYTDSIGGIIENYYQSTLGVEPGFDAMDTYEKDIAYLVEADIGVKYALGEIGRMLLLSDAYAGKGRSDAEFIMDGAGPCWSGRRRWRR